MNDAFFAGIARENNTTWRANRLAKADQLLRGLLPPQRALFEDPARYVTALTPGQAGKTRLSLHLIIDTLLRRRSALVAYVSLTQKVAKRYLWEELLALNTEHALELESHNTDGYFRAPDGGLCLFGGIESAADVERYRGSPWDLFILDETKSADQKLVQTLVEDVLPPRLATRNGRLALVGTPGAVLHGKFWEITGRPARTIRHEGAQRIATSRPWRDRLEPRWQGVDFEWSFHAWALAENSKAPHVPDCSCPDKGAPHLWQQALLRKKAKGWSDDNPIWLREYMGEWVADATNRLYRFNPERNLWKPDLKSKEPFGLPTGHDWWFVVGVDFGHSDPCAIEILAFSDTHEDLFQVWEYNQRGLSLREQAMVVKRAQDMCGERLAGTVGDPARKHILHSLQVDHGVCVEAAEKREKRDAVELVSSDMHEGRYKVLEGSELHDQVASLQWDETGLKEIAQVNDASDAGLYAHRKAQHRLASRPPPPPPPGTPEFEAEQHEAEMEAIAREGQLRDNADGDDDPFGEVFDAGENDDEW